MAIHPIETSLRWPGPLRVELLLSPWIRAKIRILAQRVPLPVVMSDVRNVVYLNWLVPTDRVRSLVPSEFDLVESGGHTFVSVLTYQHNALGPRSLGPLRRLGPSPLQSNWRVYVRLSNGKPGVYFLTAVQSEAYLVAGSRLFCDSIPVHYPQLFEHHESGRAIQTSIEPGTGSSPDLYSVVTPESTKNLPRLMAEHYGDWYSTVQYLVEQNQAVAVVPETGEICRGQIDIPIDPDEVIPLFVESLKSECLSDIILGCPTLAFLVPSVRFSLLGEVFSKI